MTSDECSGSAFCHRPVRLVPYVGESACAWTSSLNIPRFRNDSLNPCIQGLSYDTSSLLLRRAQLFARYCKFAYAVGWHFPRFEKWISSFALVASVWLPGFNGFMIHNRATIRCYLRLVSDICHVLTTPEQSPY
jgi:hypothetical protein